jgi:hypothetical protein
LSFRRGNMGCLPGIQAVPKGFFDALLSRAGGSSDAALGWPLIKVPRVVTKKPTKKVQKMHGTAFSRASIFGDVVATGAMVGANSLTATDRGAPILAKRQSAESRWSTPLRKRPELPASCSVRTATIWRFTSHATHYDLGKSPLAAAIAYTRIELGQVQSHRSPCRALGLFRPHPSLKDQQGRRSAALARVADTPDGYARICQM